MQNLLLRLQRWFVAGWLLSSIRKKLTADTVAGCRKRALSLSLLQHETTANQVALLAENPICGYDSTFDRVDTDGSGAFDLAQYVVWVGRRTPETIANATLMHSWIEYFHK